MSETKLLRCPFCDEEMIPSYKLPEHPNGYLKWLRFHPDNKCFLKAHSIDLRETESVEAWNTRKPMQNIVERLEEQAEECRKYWQEFDDEDSFGGMNAYCYAVKIVKEEGGLNET